MKIIQLTQGKSVMVDDSDYTELSCYKWFAMKNGRGLYYAVRTKVFPRVNGKQPSERIFMHKVIANASKSQLVIFNDKDTLNCCRGNLSISNQAGKSLNAKGRNTGLPKGVRKNYRKCEVRINGTSLGQFDTAELAATVYSEKQKQMISLNTFNPQPK